MRCRGRRAETEQCGPLHIAGRRTTRSQPGMGRHKGRTLQVANIKQYVHSILFWLASILRGLAEPCRLPLSMCCETHAVSNTSVRV